MTPSTQGEGYDYPNCIYAPALCDTDKSNNTSWYTSTADDHFTDWIMYNPSASQSGGDIWIPLQKLSWYWSDTCALSGTTWSTSGWQHDPGTDTIAAAHDWPTWNAYAPDNSTSEIQMRDHD